MSSTLVIADKSSFYSSRRFAEPVLFFAFWLVPVFLFSIEGNDRGILIFERSNFQPMLAAVIFEVFSKAIFVYLHANRLLLGLLVKRRYVRYLTELLAALLVFTLTETFVERQLFPLYYPGHDMPTWAESLGWNWPAYIDFIVYSTIYGFIKAWILNERQKKKLSEDKLRTELAFLKAQVNPHFLFNTLNNLFSMAHMDNSPATANGILKLANMMRYMLYESNGDRIPLEKEINYIRSYIELEQMRFTDDEDDILIQFNVQTLPESPGVADMLMVPYIEVAPMLLIPFVENAFKHGLTLQGKCKILINLVVEPDKLNLRVQNTINRLRQGKDGASGLGLENVRRRLELLYPERYKLNVSETNELFDVKLELQY